MRRMIPTLVAGSLAFGLVAAVAVDTGFSLSTGGLKNPGTAEAVGTVAVTVELCDGLYEITWEGTGEDVTGFAFVRTPPPGDADPGLEYCAVMPYMIQVVDGDTDGRTIHEGVTDEFGGASHEFDGMNPAFTDGETIRLKIGPGAAGS